MPEWGTISASWVDSVGITIHLLIFAECVLAGVYIVGESLRSLEVLQVPVGLSMRLIPLVRSTCV
jgi:hypothetical protein